MICLYWEIHMTGKWVRKSPAGQVVIFVHGVLSSGEACWKNETNAAYWPQMVADCDPELGPAVYVSTYRTGIDSATYSVNDAAEGLFEELRLDGVLGHSSIVFVCHSMGGLVVRRMLVQQQSKLASVNLGLFLVASPSLGSSYANWLTPIARFFKHAQAEVLRLHESNPWLATLDSDFLDLLDRSNIAGRELVEDRSVFGFGPFQAQQIVSPLSARRYFRDALKIPDSDHFSIAKPENENALQHRVLMEFIRLRREAQLGLMARSTSKTVTQDIAPATTDAAKILEHPNLADFLFAADEDSLAWLVACVPPGRGIDLSFVPDRFRREYLATTDSADIHDRVAAASALVRPTFPQFVGRWGLVSVLNSELPSVGQPPQEVLQRALTAARLKGPRMLAAMIAEMPQPAILAARKEVDQMLRALLRGEAA
jgi:pimeloyl-ACP methyl ester carboxylesterase